MATPTHFLLRRRTFAFRSSSRHRVGCNRWRLHWGPCRRVKSFDQCAMFYRDLIFIYVPFSLLSFVLSIFVYNLCYVIFFSVCLSIYYIHSEKYFCSMHTRHVHLCTHVEILRPIPGSVWDIGSRGQSVVMLGL